jgi:hypothetical protein
MPAFQQKLSLPCDSALSAPRRETEGQPETWQAKIHRRVPVRLRAILSNLSNCDFKESKLSDAQGQYLFREPINKNIPETGLLRPLKPIQQVC